LAGFLPTGLTPDDIEAKLAKVAADLEQEIGKRRDLRDELERQTERLQETRLQTRNNPLALKQCISILGAGGEHLDSVRILVIKKKGLTMRNFYVAFIPFQNHNQNNHQITSITSAGPIWQIQCRSPIATQGVRDAIWNYCQQNNIEVTVIKGKSNITTAKERIFVGISDSIGKIFRIEKPKGKGKGQSRIITAWPDQNHQFALMADGFNMAAGRINFDKMEYEIFISKKAASSEQVAQQLAHQIRAFDSSDRVGYLLPLNIELVEHLDNNDWGRRPRGQQGAGSAPGPFGQPVVGQQQQQQQQMGQPGKMAPRQLDAEQQQADGWRYDREGMIQSKSETNKGGSKGSQPDPWHAAAFGTRPPAPTWGGTPGTYANTPVTAIATAAMGSHSQSSSSGGGGGPSEGAPTIGGNQASLATSLAIGGNQPGNGGSL